MWPILEARRNTSSLPWQDHFTREDLIARIRQLAEEDHSQRRVAEIIGHELTGNVVRGLANRAKPKVVFGEKRAIGRQQQNRGKATPYLVSPRSRVVDQKSRVKTVVTAEAPKAGRLGFVILDEVDDFAASGPVHFNDLRSAGGLGSGVPPSITDGRCRYALWPDRLGTHYRPRSFEMFLCGKPVVPGTSWCPDCTKVVFETKEQKPRPKLDRNGRRAGWELGF